MFTFAKTSYLVALKAHKTRVVSRPLRLTISYGCWVDLKSRISYVAYVRVQED